MKEKIMQKNKILTFAFLLMASTMFSQQKNTNAFWKNVHYGGGIGLSFGDGFFSGTLAPSAIYEFNHQFGLGLGLNGTISNLKNTYKSTILGGSVIGLFNPFYGLQLSAEFEELHVNRRYESNLGLPDDNYWSPALFVGAGYRNGNVTFGVRYDVLYDARKSIYADPWAPFVRFYF
tara:strand:+ start:13207 stop:13734 length:528 start_codon:yes stop_codon:yes gene_type:complete